jgi:hypothetical protein
MLQHPGAKYRRRVVSRNDGASIECDVYDVLRAWNVTSQPLGHAIKKILQPGARGHKDRLSDLREAIVSIQAEIDACEVESTSNTSKGGGPDEVQV